MGLKEDLGLKGNDFSNTATGLFIAYLLAEFPNVYCLQKVPAAKWLGTNVFLWGIAAAAAAGATGYKSLLAARIFLGIFEATVGPSLMLINSQYYTRQEQALRFTLWSSGVSIAQILGGLISFGFQHVHHAALEGWRVMFLVLGAVTSLVGVLTFCFLPDTPMKARWLSDQERVALLQYISVNQTGVRNSSFHVKQIWEAVLDVQVWLLALAVVLTSVSSGVITTYSSTLIVSFGFSGPDAALLNMPSGVVSLVFLIAVGVGVRTTSHRWAWILACTIPGIIGASLLSFLPTAHGHSNKAGVLVGIYLVNAIIAVLPILWQWAMANCAGHTKRAFASALVAGSFSLGNIIGPQTFQARDAPAYHPAKVAVLATQASVAIVAAVLSLYYVWENQRRDQRALRAGQEGLETVEGKWEGLTDWENQAFRYVY
ncbi:hypothetical protein ASPZODRAFT_128842 [Penicilliopsis zonata CBS 506.65]|uniref:Major facilitator superfamily (MFS) profile domain-containing protein n=1 Tax=Penicilliopsis zonata CBS 506.65 TaxID=1073090 RepID=A0A1L9SSV9_9EURO|nr:hypothetical protein ASPZODRAFT_128842 [Penicilliopsis zonata CBS 506.65]OJJ50216.1 hypothetical protein ASPZODRAFT_128842 [Penicilliopsis zonata CBS 506.65]